MALMTFYQIFKLVDHKTLEFLYKTKIGGVEFDAGETISKGTLVAGLDFFRYIGNDIEVTEEPDGTKVIERIYV